jgi:hypothetical protein
MLFNQAIFVLDRPKSRLAREYKHLVTSLILHNPADRDGALRFLIGYCRSLRNYAAMGLNLGTYDLPPGVRAALSGCSFDYGLPGSGGDPLDQIAGNFPNDAQILDQIGRCRDAATKMRTALATGKIRNDVQQSEDTASGEGD